MAVEYTTQDHATWTQLYARVMQFLPETADKAVLEGIHKFGYPPDRLPDFDEINRILDQYTDWKIVPMHDMVDDPKFISMLADKKYPCRDWLRSPAQFEADLDEYDMFHDIFGHTPLLIQDAYSDYLMGLGKLALENLNNPVVIGYLKKMYWHTIQFGLITSGNTLKIYGAHFLSSAGETIYALSAGVPKYDFNIPYILDTPYSKGKYQERYYVINSYDQLKDSLSEIKSVIDKKV
jgi:phenylalanine-4-hydroxylase